VEDRSTDLSVRQVSQALTSRIGLSQTSDEVLRRMLAATARMCNIPEEIRKVTIYVV
jgi:hypothetical protein